MKLNELSKKLVMVRLRAVRQVPKCHNCGELHQVQLRSWSQYGRCDWECRECGHEFVTHLTEV